ncbi:4'-phosphopantetheinyl transferase family protein [Neomicrococcus aestuarii]|uniref:Phosphopantetheinyl transferase n=1 Tax=Neomicrococcus aestuarii TaxID=556325 RepID=A0A1L2ZLN4_9MICC|nr:hypothetical protein [Neomicrococcus aestuarii]APF40284.1 hypothetical protein BHE16_03820 [Neomicrococcus aestuarii]MBB5511663.1 phosphopantetheinyl transferase [Neomicrococcus aestuarii]
MNLASEGFPASQYDAAALALADILPSAWLTRAEERRAEQLGAAGERFVAGRLAARQMASVILGLPAPELRIVSRCEGCGSDEHGVPEIVGPLHRGEPTRWHSSLSRSDTHVILGVVLTPVQELAGRVSIGVDLTSTDARHERILAELDPSFFEEEELWDVPTRAQWWAMKEAFGKAQGTGIVPHVPNILGPQGFSTAEISSAHRSPVLPSVPGHVSCGVVLQKYAHETSAHSEIADRNGSETERRQLFLK